MDLIRNLLESEYNQETLPVAISKREQIQGMKPTALQENLTWFTVNTFLEAPTKKLHLDRHLPLPEGWHATQTVTHSATQ